MFNANVGSSTLPCAKDAGVEATKKAVQSLEDVKVAFVYASCDYNISELVSGVKEVLPNLPIL